MKTEITETDLKPGDLVDVKRSQDNEWNVGEQTEFVCFVSYKGIERYITYSGGYFSDWACCRKHHTI